MTSPETRVRAPRRRFHWIRVAGDRVPTSWLTAIATALFLAVTAAFGGLATAAEPGLATLKPDETFRNDAVALTAHRALLFDEMTPIGLYADDGKRVLAIAIDAENLWTKPLPASALESAFSVKGLDTKDGPRIRRLADSSVVEALQPGVPTQLVVAWVLDAERFSDGDELTISFDDLTLYTATVVAAGQTWEDPTPAATMTLTVSDQGAGQ